METPQADHESDRAEILRTFLEEARRDGLISDSLHRTLAARIPVAATVAHQVPEATTPAPAAIEEPPSAVAEPASPLHRPLDPALVEARNTAEIVGRILRSRIKAGHGADGELQAAFSRLGEAYRGDRVETLEAAIAHVRRLLTALPPAPPGGR